ncbi:hypothetical protein Dimus_018314 [Dionaea muscipula]
MYQHTIGRRSSPRKKQVHGQQNPLDGKAHTEKAAEIAERRVHERGRSQYHNQNQLIRELLQVDQTLEGRQSKEQMTRELHQDEEIEFTEEQSVELDPTVQEIRSTNDHERVMGKEHSECVRLYGRGVTTSSLGKTSTKSNSAFVYVPDELLQSIKDDVAGQVMAKLKTEVTR